jgi:uncharacterized membrane protein
MNSKQRILAIVLLSSLALNLFFGGIVVGKYLGHVSDSKFFQPPPMPRGPRWILESFSEASQEKVRPLIQAHRQQMEPQIRSMREARRAVHQQLTTADFNVEVLSEALAKLEQEKQKGGKMMHQLLINIASQLNEEDRQRLSEATSRWPRPPWARDRGPDFDRPEWGKP